jgi:phosphoadenosine phosphosulfate reductase
MDSFTSAGCLRIMSRCVTPQEQLVGLNLERLNREFAIAHPKSILAWCLENIPSGLIQSSAFGVSGMVTLDLLYRDLDPQPPIPILFLDTLYHFPQTLQLVKTVQAQYGIDLKIYRPLGMDSREEFEAIYGAKLWEKDLDRFQELTKVEPLQRALNNLGVKAWFTGRRRDQAHERSALPIFEWDQRGCLKVNPLANWNYQMVWKYVVEHNVPYNPLYDAGYTSIGDEPLTVIAQSGEGERGGRWRGMNRTECGMHRV